MEPEEDMEVITNFVIRNQLMETVEEVKQLEHLLKEAKERLNKQYKTIRERTWSEWIFEWFGIY